MALTLRVFTIGGLVVGKRQLVEREVLPVDLDGGVAGFPAGSWVEETVSTVEVSTFAVTTAPVPEPVAKPAKKKASARKKAAAKK